MDRRTMICRATEYRAVEENGALYIEGYFAVFNSVYEIAPGLTESIAYGAFTDTLADDIRALTNHDTTLVLGRTKAGTLALREDTHGLWGRVRINQDDGDAMNLYHRVQRGDVDQCSFGFDILEEDVEYLQDGAVHFTTRKVKLYEVSVVTFPAYEETAVSARSAQAEQIKRRAAQAWKETMKNRLKGSAE